MTKLTKAFANSRISTALVALATCAVVSAPVAQAKPAPGHGSKAHRHGAKHRHGHKVRPAAHRPAHAHIGGIVPVVHGRVHPHGPGETLQGAAAEGPGHVDLGLGTSSNRENLEYHGGPVLHTNTTYAIYWLPSGSTVSAKYTSLINGYFSNVALASGYSSNVYATSTQLYDGEGAVSSKSTFGGSYVDTTTPIPDDCSGEYQQGNEETRVTLSGCVTDADLQAEVSHAIAAAGWTPGPTKEFFIFTPRNVGSCLDSSSNQCSYTLYCAYHSSFQDAESRQVIYANIADPDTTGVGRPGACDSYQHPNGDWADAAISIVSHEHNETMTDPFGTAWFDNVGNEDGDKCAWNFGTALGSATYGKYNQLIGKGKYYVQQEWSNASRSCALTYVPTPVIWSSSAEGGQIGSEVTLTGANFSGAKYVYFNGTAATFTIVAPNTITATVPLKATSGLISVTNASGTGKSTTTFYVAPTVSSFSSTSGKVGALVTVYGTNFTGATSVSFGGVPATSFKVSEAKKLTAYVPLGAVTGPITVTGPGGSGTSLTSFTVVPWAAPTVTSFSSTSGKVSASVTVYGTNFASATSVTIGGVSATFKVSEEKKLVATVPLGAENGTIVVTGLGGIGTSSTNFTVLA